MSQINFNLEIDHTVTALRLLSFLNIEVILIGLKKMSLKVQSTGYFYRRFLS